VRAQVPADPAGAKPIFEVVQADTFAVAGAQPNAWGDFDNDGDLDLFVGFKADLPNRLYRNDNGRFTDVADALGVADLTDTRAAAWGDYDGDGNLDLYVGFTRRSQTANRLYHNDGNGRHFTEAGHAMGVDASGVESRQVSWVDYDNDGRVDLFVAFRDAPNRLFHNDGARFTNVAPALGVDDPRKTVGAVWFDFNQDGRLDVFTANQDGTTNGLYRNDGGKFVDVAHDLKMDAGGRPLDEGSNGPSVIDVDNDGDLDLFVAGYGRNYFFRQDAAGRFTETSAALGLQGGDKATPSNWGDFDNDGRPDVYISSYIDKPLNEHDFLFHNLGERFANVLPPELQAHQATHGIQWADYDGDGAIDLAIANNNPEGTHHLLRNRLAPIQAARSIEVLVLDAAGHYTKAGAEVRVFGAGTRTVLGSRLVDTGSGYCSQSAAPVHIGLGRDTKVDVEVTTMGRAGRQVTRVAGVDPATLPRHVLVVKVKE
jgi:hypothetical protein